MTSTSNAPLLVSLPSIHEMFPEYLLKISPNHRLGLAGNSTSLLSKASDTRNHQHPHIYSFDVLRSDPSSSSLQHIASSATLPNRSSTASATQTNNSRVHDVSNGSAPAFRVNPPHSSFGNPASSSNLPPPPPSLVSSSSNHLLTNPDTGSYDSEDISDDGDDKRHVCPQCHKRFNRPSSLRIHMNTHTGATPFRCPYPNCGREFNVNSNMRRHYRNHTTSASSRPQAKEDTLPGTISAAAASSVSPIHRRRRSRKVIHKSPTDEEFLVLRPDVPMHPAMIQRSSLTQGHHSHRSTGIAPAPRSPSDVSGSDSESDSSMIDDEEMEDRRRRRQPHRHSRGRTDTSPSCSPSSFRLQPVSDFNSSGFTRYGGYQHHPQSDVRSLPASTMSPPPPLTPSPISPPSAAWSLP